MAARASCTVPAAVMVEVLKAHVPSLDNRAYAADRLEEVVAAYETLLLSLAGSTERLAPGAVASAAAEVFGGPPAVLKHFAQRLSDAFSFCRRKTRHMAHGARFPPAVRAVASAMAKRASPKKGGAPSPPALPVVVAPEAKKAKITGGECSGEEILRLYGVTPSKAPPAPAALCPTSMDILSSQEVLSSQEAVAIEDDEAASSGPRSASAADPAGAPLVCWIDYARMTAVRVVDGEQEAADLFPGENGFALARFGAELVETEVSNLLLDLSKGVGAGERSKPARRIVQKSPGAPPPSPPAGSLPGPAPTTPEVVPASNAEQRRYSKMWYKNSAMFGIRQKHGAKRQIFAIGGQRSHRSKDQLAAIADEAIRRMVELGDAEEAAKAWARAESGM